MHTLSICTGFSLLLLKKLLWSLPPLGGRMICLSPQFFFPHAAFISASYQEASFLLSVQGWSLSSFLRVWPICLLCGFCGNNGRLACFLLWGGNSVSSRIYRRERYFVTDLPVFHQTLVFLIRNDGHGFEVRRVGTSKVHWCLCFVPHRRAEELFGLLCLWVSGVGFGAVSASVKNLGCRDEILFPLHWKLDSSSSWGKKKISPYR